MNICEKNYNCYLRNKHLCYTCFNSDAVYFYYNGSHSSYICGDCLEDIDILEKLSGNKKIVIEKLER